MSSARFQKSLSRGLTSVTSAGRESLHMSQEEIYTLLTQVFEDVFQEDIPLRPDLSAEDVNGWDSLTHIRLMLSVEKAFRVKFTTSDIGGLKNVGELARLIEKRSPKPG